MRDETNQEFADSWLAQNGPSAEKDDTGEDRRAGLGWPPSCGAVTTLRMNL